MTKKRIMNNRGSIAGFVLFILAVVGLWYSYRSHKAGTLSTDLSAMLTDCQRITGQVSMTAADRAVLDQAYNTISTIAAKYKVATVTPTTTP
jgi:hypothetical protein